MVQLQLVGGLFQDRSTTQKKGSHCGSNLRGFISAQHRPSNQHGSTWGQLWPTKPQLNLDPLGSNLVPIWSKMAQLHPKLYPCGSNCQHGGIAGPARNYQRTRFRWYCPLFWHRRSCAFSNVPCVVPGLCPTWREAATGCHQTSKLRQVEAMICRWVALDPSSAST